MTVKVDVVDQAPERGSVVVCIAVRTADEQTLIAIRGLLERTDATVPVVVSGRPELLERICSEVGLPASRPGGIRRVETLQEDLSAVFNEAIEASRPADVVLVVPGVVVAAEWLQRLTAAATHDSIVASATPLSIGFGGLELFAGDASLPYGEEVVRGASGDSTEQARVSELAEELALRVRRQALRLYPRIATMGPACVYIRRQAWGLAGPLESDLPLGDALERLAVRVTALGMVNVVADDVLIVGQTSEGLDGEKSTSPDEHLVGAADEEAESVQATFAHDERGPLRRSLDGGRTALRGLSVTIDARSLTAAVGGTQTYVVGLILALARAQKATVRVLVAHDIAPDTRDTLAAGTKVELLTYEEALRDPPLTDVVHRPQQIFTPEDLSLLRLVGRRIVVGQQDLIAYHNYTYHRDVDAWRAYRRTTRLAMAAADQVVFFSEHARRDALAEDLLQEQRAHVVGIGSETFEPLARVAAVAPAGLTDEDQFLLCLGADYAHKNRPFAIELLGALQRLGWKGKLVLAGSRVAHGSSRARERELLTSAPALADLVIDLGPVEEAVKQWLYAHATALLYPTLFEGFGLIPIEAANMGLPCLFAAQASLMELASEAATLIPWDADASASAVLPLLSAGVARAEHVRSLRGLAVPHWEEVAREMLAVYEQAIAAPAPTAAPRAWEELDREAYIVRLDRDVAHLKAIAQEYQDLYHALNKRVSFGLSLIDKDGLLNVNQQRALLRIASRGRLGAAILAPLDLLGRGGSDAGE
jgi:hypothetical protein